MQLPSARRSPGRRFAALTAGLLLVVGLLQGCGSASQARSVSNFCSTYAQQKKQFLTTYSGVGTGTGGAAALTDMIMAIRSLGDVSVILDRLDKVAPDDIEPDVAAVKSSWDQQMSTMGDQAGNAFNPSGMLGTMLKGLLISISSGGSWQRVGNYITENCGG